MNRAEQFKKTVDILYKAYKDGHLMHMTSCGCAVGNMIFHGLHNDNFHYQKNEQPLFPTGTGWFTVLASDSGLNPNVFGFNRLSDYVKQDGMLGINFTGYTAKEIVKIEAAFEGFDPACSLMLNRRKSDRSNSDPSGIHGLLDVIDALGEIHEAPAVADCLKKTIIDGKYNFETEEFQKLHAK